MDGGNRAPLWLVLRPGHLEILDGRERLFSVWALDIAGGEILGIDAIVNPDKLRHLGPVADYEELRRSLE